MNVQRFLHEHGTNFDVVEHQPTFDSCHLARSLSVPGRQLAKTVLLRASDGYRYALAVLPATHKVDLKKIGDILGPSVCLASEDEVALHCRDCEVGALPPFGSQLGVETIMDETIASQERIVFEGNTHHEAISMRYQDFYDLEHPLVTSFAVAS